MTDKLGELLTEIPPMLTIEGVDYTFSYGKAGEYYAGYTKDGDFKTEHKRDTHYKAVKAMHTYLKVKGYITQATALDNN